MIKICTVKGIKVKLQLDWKCRHLFALYNAITNHVMEWNVSIAQREHSQFKNISEQFFSSYFPEPATMS